MKTRSWILLVMLVVGAVTLFNLINRPDAEPLSADPMTGDATEIVEIKVDGKRTIMRMADGSLWANESAQLITKWVQLREGDVEWFEPEGQRIIVRQSDGTVWGGQGSSIKTLQWKQLFDGDFEESDG